MKSVPSTLTLYDPIGGSAAARLGRQAGQADEVHGAADARAPATRGVAAANGLGDHDVVVAASGGAGARRGGGRRLAVPWCRWCHPTTAGRLVAGRRGGSRRRSHTAGRRAERAGRHVFIVVAITVLRLERELELLQLLVRERPAVPALQLVKEGRFGSPLLLIVGAGVVNERGHATVPSGGSGARGSLQRTHLLKLFWRPDNVR
eukprot:scaffold15885_cov68-Phaeocystis_antarctica.AAC.3